MYAKCFHEYTYETSNLIEIHMLSGKGYAYQMLDQMDMGRMVRGQDSMNLRPSGYEPDERPTVCSPPAVKLN